MGVLHLKFLGPGPLCKPTLHSNLMGETLIFMEDEVERGWGAFVPSHYELGFEHVMAWLKHSRSLL